MSVEILMPRLSDSMEEGTILSWLKPVGDEIAIGEELVEIETDKANMVFESEAAGTLLEIVGEEGDTVALGAVIARIGASARVKASPLARRVAQDLSVDLGAIEGSGPGGRITKLDVERAAPSRSHPGPPPSRAPLSGSAEGPPGTAETATGGVETVDLSRLQEAVARRMAKSKVTVPHFYLEAEVDMSAAVAGREELKAAAAGSDPVPSLNDLVVKACALALREFPRANGAYYDGRLELYSRVNIGIAVAAEDALVVPTIFDADRKGLGQIAAEAKELAGRVKERTITPPELSGGTFTVSNLGMFGVTSFDAVINPPQAAILAVGAVVERPVLRAGEVRSAQLMCVTLGCDHRILYGADGARLLARIRTLLENPLALAL